MTPLTPAVGQVSTAAPARSTKRTTFALVATVIVLLAFMAWSRRWMSDDGFIYLRVVQNLRAGHGPVFNRGERVEAATGPAWTALLAFADLVTPIRLEWLAVFLGIGCTLIGAATGAAAAITIRRTALGDDRLLVPFGLVVFAAIPAVWDYATSGLETGLLFAWLGIAALLLARWAAHVDWRSRRVAGWTAAAAGFGPLIRPDLLLFTVAFVACLLVPRVGRSPLRHRLHVLTFAFALPFGYEVFRIGYYAALVPNTAFAKESTIFRWGQGYRYLDDFVGSYWLFIPAFVLAVALFVMWRDLAEKHMTGVQCFVLAILLSSGADALYTVAIGGSHMHARLFLPALFGVMVPVAVVPLDRARLQIASVLAWAIVCAVALRPPPITAKQLAYGVVDLRVAFTEYHPHPVTIQSHIDHMDVSLRRIVTVGHVRLTAPFGLQGAIAYDYGPSVYVFDDLGLADWLTARLPLNVHAYPDHQKITGTWETARLSLVTGIVPANPDPATVAALKALGCGDLRELRQAVSAPLTIDRFVHNAADAFTLYRMRIPQNPRQGVVQFCGNSRDD